MNPESYTEQGLEHFYFNRGKYAVLWLALSVLCIVLCVVKMPNVKPFWLVVVLIVACVAVGLIWWLGQALYELRTVTHIQQILLNTSHENEAISYALHQTGMALAAEAVFFFRAKEDGTISESYGHKCDATPKSMLCIEDQFIIFKALLKQTNDERVCLWTPKKHADCGDEVTELMKRNGIRNMACVKIFDASHGVLGVTIALNAKKMTKKIYFENIARSLLTSVINVSYVKKLENMGKYDFLTGLLNRNSYHQALVDEYQGMSLKNLTCIYIDLNGLHNLNNQFRHEAGDRMLCNIADALIKRFGKEHTFRIGGDEFVAFCREENRETVEKQIESIQQELAAIDCHASFGIEWCDGSVDINEAIKRAETKMYEAKNEYYKTVPRI